MRAEVGFLPNGRHSVWRGFRPSVSCAQDLRRNINPSMAGQDGVALHLALIRLLFSQVPGRVLIDVRIQCLAYIESGADVELQ